MYYLLILVLLFLAELFYFKIADRCNIIDKPNERSSHTKVTLRGGGIIFYFGALAYFLMSGFEYLLSLKLCDLDHLFKVPSRMFKCQSELLF